MLIATLRPLIVSTFSQTFRNAFRQPTAFFTMGALGTQTVDTTARIAALRQLMTDGDRPVQAFVVPSEDQREDIRIRSENETDENIDQIRASILHIATNGVLLYRDSMVQRVSAQFLVCSDLQPQCSYRLRDHNAQGCVLIY
jgi:hypothetical protein